MDFATILGIVKGAAEAGPAFKSLFEQVLTVFSPAEQDELKTAYAKARQGSDDSQSDFVDAGRGG